ncbi:MAG: YcfL family protein [Planctomycetota bacterium]|nr:YcfL family protein [Planctomycetota bacterium]
MYRLPLIALVALGIFAAGCTNARQDTTAQFSPDVIFLDHSLAKKLSVVQVTEGESGGLATSQVRLQNLTSRPLKTYIRAKFFDAAGREVPASLSHYNVLLFRGAQEKSYSAVAPNTAVTKIRFEIYSGEGGELRPPDRR